MSENRIDHVVVPGTFDPITLGHLDVIRRARHAFPRVTVAVATSAGKNGSGTAFTLDERVDLAARACSEAGLTDGVEVRPLTGLLVEFCHEVGASAVVKGLRATTDFEYELQQASLNGRLAPDIESVFVMSPPELGFVSSSVVRELARLHAPVDMLVPACVLEALATRF